MITVNNLIDELTRDKDLRNITHFVSDKDVIRVSRQRRYAKGARSETYIVTFGKPNYQARQHIKKAKAMGGTVETTMSYKWPVKKKKI